MPLQERFAARETLPVYCTVTCPKCDARLSLSIFGGVTQMRDSIPPDLCLPVRDPARGLNPGIRKLVGALNEAGFATTDSGDGRTHDYACDRPYGYIVVLVPDKNDLVAASDRLRGLLERLGLRVVPQAEEAPPAGSCTIQATYCPVDGYAVIDISHVHDRMLR